MFNKFLSFLAASFALTGAVSAAERVESHEWLGGTRSVLVTLEELAPVTDLFVLSQQGSGDHDWLLREASLRLGVPVLAVPDVGQ